MSWYPSENEVLLLPMFAFQVVNVVQDTKYQKLTIGTADDPIGVEAKVTTVTLVELPHQNMLEIREVV